MSIPAAYRRLAPSPDDVKMIVEFSTVGRAEMAAAIYVTERTLRKYEDGDLPMHPALFELANLKALHFRMNALAAKAKAPPGENDER